MNRWEEKKTVTQHLSILLSTSLPDDVDVQILFGFLTHSSLRAIMALQIILAYDLMYFYTL